ncbi:NAD(P)-dependent oxidoreductase [Vibrio cidicii]|uniref:NAD(P)-dependent oxidoreductase n=1 Tax=Vibrio cidicii TaxID=1763883 RepID=A0ABR5VZU2_9VIBR|nr:NAD(P)H-binding protein [Vibrio cidicii]KYN85050.1 NAD(P)-dependent oxidoreductase [Vibrio cidicii]
MSNKKYLVTGANSKLGKLVITFLLNEYQIKPSQLIATSRNPASLQYLTDQGIETRAADYADRASMVQAFQGVDNLLLVSMDTVGKRDEMHGNAVQAAEAAGVKFIAYTSMPNPETSPVFFAFEHEATEKAIAQSQIPAWKILRNNWYFDNLIDFYANVFKTKAWLTASGEGRHAQISRADLALAAAAALVKSEGGKETITLNGPESLTTSEMTEQINLALSTNINVVHLSEESLKEQLKSFQVSEGEIVFATTMDRHLRENKSDGTSEAFQALTGKKPQRFADWLVENKHTLAAMVGD